MSQHSGLTPEIWSRYDRSQQILMIGNEMNRAAGRLAANDTNGLRRCYERVLRLVDLTVAVSTDSGFLRELLRWRDLVATMYIAPSITSVEHASAFQTLLLFTPESAKQIPHLSAVST